MAITSVGYTSAAGVTSISLDVPPGVQDGDFLILMWRCGVPSIPDGWTVIDTQGAGTAHEHNVLIRWADNEPESYTLSASGSQNAIMAARRGVDPTTPIADLSNADGSNISTLDLPSVDAIADDTWLDLPVSMSTSATVTFPPPMTQVAAASGNFSSRWSRWGLETDVDSGATGIRALSFSTSVSNVRATLIALNPQGAPPPTDLAGRFVAGPDFLGGTTQAHNLSGRFAANAGFAGDAEVIETVIELAGRFVAGPDFLAAITQGHDLSGRFIVGADFIGAATRSGSVDLAGRFVVGPDFIGASAMAHNLSGRFVAGPDLSAIMKRDHNLAGRFVVGPRFAEQKLGRGTGLVVERAIPLDFSDQLRVGDTFHVWLPYGPEGGQTGLARLLERTINTDGQVSINAQFISTDASDVLPVMSQGLRITYTPSTTNNPFRRIESMRRQLNRLQRNRNE